MSAMTKKEWMEYLEKTWDAAQKEAWSEPQFECPRCGHCCQALDTEQEPVAWMHNFITNNVITHIPADIGRHPERWTALYKDPTPCKTCESLAMAVMNDQTYHEKVIPKREWVGLTEREVELIDEMIETQLLHAERCDHMANSTMAQKQKAWDLERVELLRKLKEKNT